MCVCVCVCVCVHVCVCVCVVCVQSTLLFYHKRCECTLSLCSELAVTVRAQCCWKESSMSWLYDLFWCAHLMPECVSLDWMTILENLCPQWVSYNHVPSSRPVLHPTATWNDVQPTDEAVVMDKEHKRQLCHSCCQGFRFTPWYPRGLISRVRCNGRFLTEL